jgi:hypothetical protein
MRLLLNKAFFVSIVCWCLTANVVFAQTPAPQQPPAAPQNPPPVKVQSILNVGVNFDTGVTDQAGLTLSGAILRRSPLWSMALEGDEAYSDVTIEGVKTVVADAQNLKFTVERNLTPRTYLMVRPAYKRNAVQSIDYRFEELAGYGFRLADLDPQGRLQINAVPVAGAVQQKKNIPEVDGGHFAAGGFENIAYQLKPGWTVTHFFIYLKDFRAGKDYRLQTTNALVGEITHHVGLNVSYSIDHENVVFAGEQPDDRRFVVALSLTF